MTFFSLVPAGLSKGLQQGENFFLSKKVTEREERDRRLPRRKIKISLFGSGLFYLTKLLERSDVYFSLLYKILTFCSSLHVFLINPGQLYLLAKYKSKVI